MVNWLWYVATEGWVWWWDGCDNELLRAGCDGKLVWWRTTESCDGELFRPGCDGKLLRYVCDGYLLRTGCDEQLGGLESWVLLRDAESSECDKKMGVIERYWELGVMESWVWCRAGYDGKLLRAVCDGELGVMESYWELGLIESWVWWWAIRSLVWWRVGCDRELLRAGCDGESGVIESWAW